MYVTFRVGSLELAVPVAAVTAIVAPHGLRRLPGMEPVMAGVMLAAGEVVGIVDLARFAGAATAGPRAVVVLAGEPRLGLLVESPDAVPRAYEEASLEAVDSVLPLLGSLRCVESRFYRVDLDGLRSRLRALPAGRRQRGGEDGDPDSGGR